MTVTNFKVWTGKTSIFDLDFFLWYKKVHPAKKWKRRKSHFVLWPEFYVVYCPPWLP
jgi:hypothetical protein